MADRWIDLVTAKRLLANTCDFLELDNQGPSDFVIPGREAIIASAYTGAFFLLDDEHCSDSGPL